ncbi:hypothetical protein [Mesonia aestuariivivens]|uniref:GNAT family N-acetyltransferase n=1 Tax=Mesonia aestuariivivens TaxID=2796128 RepID=A0ABS6W3Z2_9FLAO|nr:hypothetical protein [Mesonia aestuariivivens]MBW2962583.1 hypothetical protein [Mesonia aestuariivivens]
MDKEVIIRRVAEILKETPAAMQIVKKGGNRDRRFHYLAKHMVEKAIEKDALVLSENEMGIAIVFQNSKSKDSFLKEAIEDIKLVLNVTGFKNVSKILRNQNYIKGQRPKNEDYLYCWFWGISKEARGADTQVGKQMKDEFLKRSRDLNLALYAETQTRRNTIVYQKFGFELFHTWNRPDGNTMYFMKHLPEKLKAKNAKED